jgi:CarD family transcriptional regulator
MTINMTTFSVGDWIVHRQYGIGQIQTKEEKNISGRIEEYYRVKTPDSEIWLPIKKLDQSWFRPLATPGELDEAKSILQKPPRQMDTNFVKRKDRINKVQSENAIPAIARLIRDLFARQIHKSLSDTEQRALRHLTERFIAEWSVCLNLEQEIARSQLSNLLNQGVKAN